MPRCTHRSAPGGRVEAARVATHVSGTGRPLRTLRTARADRSSHDAIERLRQFFLVFPVVRIIGKALSTRAAAWSAPPAIRRDRTSPFGARSEQMRSMFSVFVCFFGALLRSPGCRPESAKVGVFMPPSLERPCAARARGPNEPGGDPGGPGGEAQRPDGGRGAWTERARESPGQERG